MNVSDLKPIYYDLETPRGMILFSFLCGEEWKEFEISPYRNDIYAFIKFIQDYKDYHFVSYNGLSFDSQIIQYVMNNIDEWHDMNWEYIVFKIYQFAQDTINDSNYEVRPPYREWKLWAKQIDLMRIHHFDNEAKRTSLKWLEFMMDMPNIEEMPTDHTHAHFSEEEAAELRAYCRNDIIATKMLWNFTVGEVSNEVYKGKNKLQDRLDVMEEFELPWEIMNYSDVKIGDELNKRGYMKLKRISYKELFEIRRKRRPTRKFTFGDCIPDYISFETKELQDFRKIISRVKVALDGDKQEFKLDFRGTQYTIAKGGIHSNERNRCILPSVGEILRDADVGSQYPNAISKRRLYPAHLGEEWLVNYTSTIVKRIEYKTKSGDKVIEEHLRKRYKGVSEMYKLALNGGGFGKTNEPNNWQYDPPVTFYCTIGNQFEILMLIERMELSGIHVVSANTDGIVCLFPREQEQAYKDNCSWWEQKVGNHEMGKLEFTDFKELYQEAVNTYVAVKTDDKLKIKGRFAWENELNKNNTKDLPRISREAIIQYFGKKVPLDHTITNCKDPFMFMIGLKSSSNYHYESIHPESGVKTTYRKIIRFYITKGGERLIKVKNVGSEAKGADVQLMYKGALVRVMNQIDNPSVESLNIDYSYYIQAAHEVISYIERNKIRKQGSKKIALANPDQTSLF